MHRVRTRRRSGLRFWPSLRGGVESGVLVEPPFYCDYGSHIHIGHRVAINFQLRRARLRYGADWRRRAARFVGPYLHRRASPGSRRTSGPRVGLAGDDRENVWIGGGAFVCPGVTIGAGHDGRCGERRRQGSPARRAGRGQPLPSGAAGRQYPLNASRRTISSPRPSLDRDRPNSSTFDPQTQGVERLAPDVTDLLLERGPVE